MKKVTQILHQSQESKTNLEYWMSKSDEERLSAVQELREQYIQLFNKQKDYDESRKRLRRVCRAVKQI